MDPTWTGYGPYGEFQYTPTIDLSGDHMQHFPQQMNMEGEDSQQGIGQNAQKSPRSRAKKKGVPKRNKNFSNDEDVCLVSAYLNVSKDPIVGVNQPVKTYWVRITDYFHEHKTSPYARTQSSLQHRWGDISKETAKFCSVYGQVERKKQSGVNENDMRNEALKIYEGMYGGPFRFIHCWLLLRDEQKWSTLLATLNGAESSKENDGKATDNNDETLPPKIERPMGRDRAKRQKSNLSSSSSTACLEVLQKMSIEQRAFEERQEAATREDALILAKRSEKKLDLQKRTVMLQEQTMLLQKETLQIQNETLQMHKDDREERFMTADVERMPPWIRHYYIKKQKEIASYQDEEETP